MPGSTWTSLEWVRGFNYSGSWGTSGLDLWLHHDHGLMAVEVARGKEYFPGWNVARWWLSHDAFQRNPERFMANFDAGLHIFDQHEIRVLPVLFNRWRDPVCDFGGVSLEHLVPGMSGFAPDRDMARAAEPGLSSSGVGFIHRRYLETVVGSHGDDPRILAWDLCNEPMMAPYIDDDSPFLHAELSWLTWSAEVCRRAGMTQPLTIGHHPSAGAVRLTESLCDFISFHPYYVPVPAPDGKLQANGTKPGFEALLDDVASIATATGKPLLASETAWGSNDDAERVEIMRYTLGQLEVRGIGFLAHALHHSLVADLHSAEWGPVGWPGRLEFINADGTLRAGHGAFNEFTSDK